MRRVRRSDCGGDAPVPLGGQVVGRDARRLGGVGRADAHLAAARGFRLQTLAVKASKACSGSPNASSDSGCTWYSRFGQRQLRAAARERAELRRRHAHRPAARQAYSGRCAPCPERRRQRVERARAVDAEHGAHLQVVLQVGADAGQLVAQRDAGRPAARPAPMPESCRICGEPIAPAASSTSPRREPRRRRGSPPPAGMSRRRCAPRRRRSTRARRARRSAPAGWGALKAGRRKALAAFQRTPPRWLTSK